MRRPTELASASGANAHVLVVDERSLMMSVDTSVACVAATQQTLKKGALRWVLMS